MSRFTHFGSVVKPLLHTKRRVAGGECIDVIATHPADGKEYVCTVNFANLIEHKPRTNRMVEIVLASLKEAAGNALNTRKPNLDCPNYKAYVTLACAVDETIADLEHALSDHPCNHGACLNTTLSDGTPAHNDKR